MRLTSTSQEKVQLTRNATDQGDQATGKWQNRLRHLVYTKLTGFKPSEIVVIREKGFVVIEVQPKGKSTAAENDNSASRLSSLDMVEIARLASQLGADIDTLAKMEQWARRPPI